MSSEWALAMRQSAPSQASRANPFSKRTWLVFSNARRSISVASAIEGEARAYASARTGCPSAVDTRRGVECAATLAVSEASRATGCGWMFCADDLWHNASSESNRKLEAIE